MQCKDNTACTCCKIRILLIVFCGVSRVSLWVKGEGRWGQRVIRGGAKGDKLSHPLVYHVSM